MAKSTDAQIQLRLNTIYEMVVKGASRRDIVRYCSEQYKITSRQTDEYLKRTYEDIKTTFSQEDKELIVSKQLMQLDDLYAKNYESSDFRECRMVVESRSKLLGLNEPVKQDITTNGKDVTTPNLTSEQVDKLLDKL
tara:strand:+ start:250 stop:660 length:411 start_codon:yes stop_codon:yes gene_type:complete